MLNKTKIFSSRQEDFIKIFLPTILIFMCILMTKAASSALFIFVTVYFLDGGHVYSTFLEVLGDSEEARKTYVAIVLLGSFFLNLIIHYFFTSYFFYYIFYFTIYHNMRQGLGVTFLYRLGDKAVQFVKWSYYFLTVTPFVLFHLRPSIITGVLGEQILNPFDLYQFFSAQHLAEAYRAGLWSYVIGAGVIAGVLLAQKNMRGLLSMFFFTFVYAYAFIISDNEVKSYAVLIFSHAIPYYFLMEKRIKITHNLNFMQKFAWIFLIIAFIGGGYLEVYQRDIVSYFTPMDSLAMALLTTPLIAHFIFDAIIWKRGINVSKLLSVR